MQASSKSPGCSPRVLGLLLAVLLVAAPASGESSDAPAALFEFADFTLLVSADASTVRGLLLSLGGPDTWAFASDGPFGAPVPELEAALHELGHDLRTLDADYGLAMLGTARTGESGLRDHRQNDELLFEAIGEAARLSGHPELTAAPLFLYAISGGTPAAIGLAARNPGRVAALLLKVPALPERLSGDEALAVPTYLILAEHETFADNDRVVAMFKSNRRAGGLWALAIEPGVPHHSLTPGHRGLTVNWLRALVELRLDVAAHGRLPAIPESSGWLGHPEFGVADWAAYPGDRRAASWFPTAATAREWWGFRGGRDAP